MQEQINNNRKKLYQFEFHFSEEIKLRSHNESPDKEIELNDKDIPKNFQQINNIQNTPPKQSKFIDNNQKIDFLPEEDLDELLETEWLRPLVLFSIRRSSLNN